VRERILIVAVLSMVIIASTAKAEPRPIKDTYCPYVKQQIAFYKKVTWKWQEMRGVPKTKASKEKIPASACAYLRYVSELWQKRAEKARLTHEHWARWHVIPATSDWVTAVSLVQRIYPGTKDWLLYISRREGGYGGFVMNHQGSGAGGWMQFMSSTYWAYSNAAYANARDKGFVVSQSTNSWSHPLGQALTAGYMRYTGRDGCHWCL